MVSRIRSADIAALGFVRNVEGHNGRRLKYRPRITRITSIRTVRFIATE